MKVAPLALLLLLVSCSAPKPVAKVDPYTDPVSGLRLDPDYGIPVAIVKGIWIAFDNPKTLKIFRKSKIVVTSDKTWAQKIEFGTRGNDGDFPPQTWVFQMIPNDGGALTRENGLKGAKIVGSHSPKPGDPEFE